MSCNPDPLSRGPLLAAHDSLTTPPLQSFTPRVAILAKPFKPRVAHSLQPRNPARSHATPGMSGAVSERGAFSVSGAVLVSFVRAMLVSFAELHVYEIRNAERRSGELCTDSAEQCLCSTMVTCHMPWVRVSVYSRANTYCVTEPWTLHSLIYGSKLHSNI